MRKMDVDLLISEVYKLVPLWNQSHPDHHNRYVLDKSWGSVAKELNTTRESVRNKWKYLRDTYRKEIAKIPKVRSGDSQQGPDKTSSWPYFKSLHFMKDQFTPRPLKGNLQFTLDEDKDTSQSIHGDSESTQEINDNDETMVSETDDFDEGSPEAYFTDNLPTPSTSRSTSESRTTNKRASSETSKEPRHTPINKRKRPNELLGQALLNIEQQKLQYIKEKGTTPIINDEDTQFFESLLPHVRKIESNKKLLFRTHIQQLVQEYAYGNVIQQYQLPAMHEDNIPLLQQPSTSHSNNNNYVTYTSL